jgi:hypothetical protein
MLVTEIRYMLSEKYETHPRPAHQTHQNRTFEFHMRPLPHLINSTDFNIQRPTALL